jgi:hypothetical protein
VLPLGVNMGILPDESINTILGWIEKGVKTQAERRQQRELYKTLSNEYAIAAQKNLSWLSLRLLATSMGLDPLRAEHLDVTRKLLRSLPQPPGPARPSRMRPKDGAKDYDQKWGLISDPRVGP